MSYHLRAPIVFAPALVLISFLTAAGQTNSNLDRTLSANTSSVDRRGRTRAVTRTAQLPFEQSVIIYYKGPGKTSTQSNAAAVPTSRANAATGKGEDSTKELTS